MENEEMPTLEQDLADIDARAAEARAQNDISPFLQGVSPVGQAVGKAVPAIGGWIKNLPKNLTLGTLDALSNTASTLWDGLRSELTDSGDYGDEQSTGAKLLGDKQYTNPVVPAPDPSTMTPEQLRAGSSDYAAFQQKQADLPIPIDVQAGQAYRDWRNSLREDDNLGDSLTQGVAQFAVPFLGYAKGLGITGAPNLANFGRALAAEGVTSATAFDPHDGRFADLVDLGRHSEGKLGDVLRTIAPDDGLINAYIEYMTDRDGEGEAEGRFKNVIDNTVGSLALAGFLKTAVGTIKAGRNLPKALSEYEMKRPGGRAAQRGTLDLSLLDSEPRHVPLGNVASEHTGSVLDNEFVVPGSQVLTVGAKDGKPQGFIAFKENDDGSLQINRTKVADDARGQGLGKQLLMSALDYADKVGRPLVSDNTVTVAQLRVYDALQRANKIKVTYSDPAAVEAALKTGDARVPVKGKGGQPVVTKIERVKE